MDVSFIVMPFASANRPAIGVSLLKSALKDMGVSSVIHYFNIKFAEKIGPKLYDKVAEHEYAGASLIGELIFSHIGFKRLLRQKEHLKGILFDIFEKRYDEWSAKNVKESLEDFLLKYLK